MLFRSYLEGNGNLVSWCVGHLMELAPVSYTHLIPAGLMTQTVLYPIEHDPWQLTSFLTTLYDDYTRSEVQGKLKAVSYTHLAPTGV